MRPNMDTNISMRPNEAKYSEMRQHTVKWGTTIWNWAKWFVRLLKLRHDPGTIKCKNIKLRRPKYSIMRPNMDTHISMRPNKAKCSQMWQNTLKWGKIQWNEATQYQIGRNGLLGCSVMSWLMCHQIQIHKRREFQTQILHYFAKTDNKSNHDHQVGQKSVLCGQLWTKFLLSDGYD